MICDDMKKLPLVVLLVFMFSAALGVEARAETGANVRFAGSDVGISGMKLPVALQLANTSAADIRQVRIKTNQLFEYRLDVLIPARQTGDVTFEPWYFDGSLNLSAIEGLDAAGKLLVSYAPAKLRPSLGGQGAASSGSLLDRLAARTHVRPDLIGYVDQNKGQIPTMLFQGRSWQLADVWHFLIPALAVTAVLVCLALVAELFSHRIKIAAMVVVALGGAVWAVALVEKPLYSVDAVSVVSRDGSTGQALVEDLAAVTALRAGPATLYFKARLQPRPLVAAEADRVMYEGVILHRHEGGEWSVENIPATPGLILAFEAGEWDISTYPSSGGKMFWVQSGVPGVRLGDGARLEDAWCYLAGRAWRMGLVDEVYRPTSEAVSIDAAAFSAEAPADAFRRRAMRWVAQQYVRQGVGVLFGWFDGNSAVELPAAAVSNHGRLVMWLFPEPKVVVEESEERDKAHTLAPAKPGLQSVAPGEKKQ